MELLCSFIDKSFSDSMNFESEHKLISWTLAVIQYVFFKLLPNCDPVPSHNF